jgi:hypothetical protein
VLGYLKEESSNMADSKKPQTRSNWTIKKDDKEYEIVKPSCSPGEQSKSFASNKSKSEQLSKELLDIPERERWLWKNPEALALVKTGLEQAAKGRGVSLGSLAEQYPDILADLDADDD